MVKNLWLFSWLICLLQALNSGFFPQLEIRAYDQGEPVLDSTLQLMIMVKQVVTMPPESGMGFAELNFPDVQILENSIPGTLIQTLEIVQKPDRDIKINCDVVEVINDKGEKVRSPGKLSFYLFCRLV